jgi:hypothetical protein
MEKPTRKQVHLAGKLYGLTILANMDLTTFNPTWLSKADDEPEVDAFTLVRSAMIADARRSLTMRRIPHITSEEDALRIAMTLTT